MGVDPGNKQFARISTDVSIATKSHSSRSLKEVVGEDQQRDRSDDPDIAETVLRFIPFSAVHEESAVSFPRRKSNCGAQFTRITPAARRYC
jgi:hypothetical protein